MFLIQIILYHYQCFMVHYFPIQNLYSLFIIILNSISLLIKSLSLIITLLDLLKCLISWYLQSMAIQINSIHLKQEFIYPIITLTHLYYFILRYYFIGLISKYWFLIGLIGIIALNPNIQSLIALTILNPNIKSINLIIGLNYRFTPLIVILNYYFINLTL